MIIDDKINDEKLQYNVNREAAKTSPFSSDKIDKYEYLTGEEMLPSDQSRITEQAKFTFSPFGKAFEKLIKAIEEQGKNQVEASEVLRPKKNQELETIEGIFPKKIRHNEIKNEIDEIKKWEEIIKRKDLKYETNKNRFDFQQFKTISFFGDNIYNGKINIKEAKMKQAILLENILDFRNKSRPRSNKDKEKKTKYS